MDHPSFPGQTPPKSHPNSPTRKTKHTGDMHASEVSDALPFIELELHKQLLYKLKIRNLNAAFGLKVTLEIGDGLIIAVATATGVLCHSRGVGCTIEVGFGVPFAGKTVQALQRFWSGKCRVPHFVEAYLDETAMSNFCPLV